MELWRIRKIAKRMGLGANRWGLDKRELVRAIQRAEGYFDCFGSAVEGVCDQVGCKWRQDCFAEAAVEKKAS